ncbi:putative Astacin-like metalloendopeptidase [Hypsibius exemplaris]|uniref:Metalloendopeptidase n=1 Tax=Hypsibius exemplaris TaxID=2072580 RepID=A0A1W0X9B6_HYPEX|nr:putative Astacin-like metalloendopeptidase [Hypsibius exemplaris]
MQMNGDLVVSIIGGDLMEKSVWSSGTSSLARPPVSANLRQNGDLVMLNDEDETMWRLGTTGTKYGGASLWVQNGGLICLANEPDGNCLWASVTAVTSTPIPKLIPSLNTTKTRPAAGGSIDRIDGEFLATDGSARNKAQNDFRWPGGVVPYIFSRIYEQTSAQHYRMLVLKVMEGFENSTCIRFVQLTNQTDYLIISSSAFCSSGVVGNRHSGGQRVYISIVCLSDDHYGKAQHQLMHSLGFDHEHARIDRDEYVDINFSNIATDERDQFQKFENNTGFGEPYDFDSILHDGMFDWAIDPSVWTVRPKEKYKNKQIGQQLQLSPGDIRKINKFYNCSADLLRAPSTAATTTGRPICVSTTYFGACVDNNIECSQACENDGQGHGKCGRFRSMTVCICDKCSS